MSDKNEIFKSKQHDIEKRKNFHPIFLIKVKYLCQSNISRVASMVIF